jgi:metallophosphoesterase (TIGR00282 family)
MELKILCIGDIVGRPGRQVLAEHLVHLVKEHDIHCVIANAENSAGGSGITSTIYDKLMKYGVHLVTMGDHIFRKRDIFTIFSQSDRIVRPINLSSQAAGREWAVFTTQLGSQVAVVSILGRMHMPLPTDNPFHAIDRVLRQIPSDIKTIVVDIHAEVTSEKIAMGWFLDGRVSIVYGTHTHVVTADETILPQGTAYITDLGMTGPHESVLGRSVDRVLKSLTTQMPNQFSIATGDLRLNSILVSVDSNTGKALDIQRLCLKGTLADNKAYDESDKSNFSYSKK